MNSRTLYRSASNLFKNNIKKFGITVNVHYANKNNNAGWGNDQLKGTFQNVKVLQEIVKNSVFEKSPFVNIMEGKSVFYIPFNYVFEGEVVPLNFADKTDIRIEVIASGQSYQIDKVMPFEQIGDKFVFQLAVQA
jgi:hypothetical protein